MYELRLFKRCVCFISAKKYEHLQSRKPDFDPPNIVNLLHDIFMHYGKDGFVS